MKTIGGYAIETTTTRSFEDTLTRVTELLAAKGFGVLTEIDIQATLKKKLGVDVRPYRILGACNPPFAHQALEAEPHVGVLLPCNIAVWDAGTHRVVAAMEPNVMSSVIGSDALTSIAAEVSARIHAVIEGIERTP
jgi:uncharacterized protein (DUF302 family)